MNFSWLTKKTIEHGHSQAEIESRINDTSGKFSYLRDAIYGGMDGAVTTLAIVAGVAGAGIDRKIVIALGIANVLADGFSMAASNYTGIRAESERIKRLQAMEERHILENPAGERLEIAAILRSKGIQGKALDDAVNAFTAHKGLWVDMMLLEEHGVSPLPAHPFNASVATFIAFIACGAVPLIPFIIGMDLSFQFSVLATGLVFLLIGSVKSRWSMEIWWVSACQTFLIGTTAACIAWFAGRFVAGLS